jgi:hypothetical protein
MKKILLLFVMIPMLLPGQEVLILDIDFNTIRPDKRINSINTRLHNAALYNKLQVYDQNLTTIIPAEELPVVSNIAEVVAVYPNPDDPYEVYDTTVVVPFSASSLDGYLIMVSYNEDEKEIQAIAPFYYFITEDRESQPRALYWIKLENIPDVLFPEDYQYLNEYILQVLKFID